MKHALIVGVSGILGRRLAQELLARGDWKISGIARKPTPYQDINNRIHLVICDLLKKDESSQILSKLTDVTHVFYAAWVPGDSEQHMTALNLKMMEHLFVPLSEHSKGLQHVYFQTGTKYYGMMNGPGQGMVTPSRESDPRLAIPNFYYDQEDLLKELSRKYGWRYSISRPPCIIGFALKNQMAFGVNLAVYATVMKELGKPLLFPSNTSFQKMREIVDVGILARFALWTSTHPFAHGEAFNITNGDGFRFENLWPKIADYFGMDWKVEKNFSVKDFMKQHHETWRRIGQKYELASHEIEEFGDFSFMDDVIKRDWDDMSVVSKAREFGFHETLNSETCFFNLFDELQLRKMIPVVRPGPARRH